MLTAQDLVRREVHYCVSSLVSEMAKYADNGPLGEQAYDLCAPVADYEEAAREAGWSSSPNGEVWKHYGLGPRFGPQKTWLPDWVAACDKDGLEPHYREVYEHWIVSDWLADKLSEKGEKVDKDFAGMTIWARTTTGQAIYCDHVIEQITAEVNKA